MKTDADCESTIGNTTDRYDALSMLLHWVMAVLISGLLALGLYMTSPPDGDPKWAWYGLHKSFGLMVHSSLGYALMAALALHLGAVAKHQLILKDNTLRRMLP